MQPANHLTITSKEIEAAIDTAAIDGQPAVSLSFKGRPVHDPKLENGPDGPAVTAVLESVRDGHTLYLRLLVPAVNVEQESVVFSTVALLTTVRSSIGGPQLVEGPINLYEVQPAAGLATAVQS